MVFRGGNGDVPLQLCSLSSLVICTVVSQVALLTACSNFISIYPNLFEFILNLYEFLSEKRKNADQYL